MKTDGNLDPGGDGAAFAHRRKELPAAYGGESRPCPASRGRWPRHNRISAAAPLGSRRTRTRSLALLAKLDGARRVDGGPRRRAEAGVMLPDDRRLLRGGGLRDLRGAGVRRQLGLRHGRLLCRTRQGRIGRRGRLRLGLLGGTGCFRRLTVGSSGLGWRGGGSSGAAFDLLPLRQLDWRRLSGNGSRVSIGCQQREKLTGGG